MIQAQKTYMSHKESAVIHTTKINNKNLMRKKKKKKVKEKNQSS